eukprot:496572-Pyramimonas_sp.AAC.1
MELPPAGALLTAPEARVGSLLSSPNDVVQISTYLVGNTKEINTAFPLRTWPSGGQAVKI